MTDSARRFIGAAIALLLVAACGAPTPSVSDVPAPSITTSASSTPEATPSSAAPSPSPSGSGRPLPATLPPDPTAMGVRCATNGPAFPQSALTGLPGAELGLDAAGSALREAIATYGTDEMRLPEHGWYRAFEASGQVLFVVRTTAEPGWAMVALRAGQGGWTVDEVGACDLRPTLPAGVTYADWWLDPAKPAPTATTTALPLELMELSCTGGRSPEGRVLDPLVIYQEQSILIAFAIRDLPGDNDCPGNPPHPYVLQLTEPLGDRTLLDASRVPPSPPLGP